MSGFNGARFTSCCSSVQLKRVWQGLSGKHSSHRRANEGARAPRPPSALIYRASTRAAGSDRGAGTHSTLKRPPRAPGRTWLDLIKDYGNMYVNFYHPFHTHLCNMWISRRVLLQYLSQSSKSASCFPYSRKTSFRHTQRGQTQVTGHGSRIYTLHTES